MTIDEQLKALLESTQFLKQSTESLHSSLEAEIAERRRRDDLADERHRRADGRERRSRQAIAAAIAAYITALNSNGDEQTQQ